MRSLLRLAACLLALLPALHGAAASHQVTVGPAPVERAAQVVSLTLPEALAAGATLRDARGEVVPLQVEADLTARFIVARQAANETLKFTLEPGRVPDQGNVQVVEEPSPPRPGNTPGIESAIGPSRIQAKTGRLRVSVGGRPILYYQMDRDAVLREDIDPKLRRAGYLHPVLTPRGVSVTEDYPADNPTQHGIAPLGPENAHLEFGAIDNTWSGPVHGGFTSWQRWVDDKAADAPVLVNEAWEFTAYAVPKSLGEINVFDLVIVQTNATSGQLAFVRGLALRRAAWDQRSNLALSNSSKDIENSFHWFGFSGRTKEDTAGLALLLSESTLASPPQGASPTFIVSTPSSAEWGWIPPNNRSTLRHRVVVFDGPPDRALLDAIWNGYTMPAIVTINAAVGRER